jgi:hypothetical protein
MKPPGPEGAPQIDVSIEELEALVEQARLALSEEGYQKLRAAIHTLGYVTELLEKKETSLAELRELLCPASTEKTSKVLARAGIEAGEKKPAPENPSPGPESVSQKRSAAGHGRKGAAAYEGAQKVEVPHASLKAGDPCPDPACDGKVYLQRDPGVLVRIKGQAPIAATVYELEKLRCHLCGKVFTAAAPEGVGDKKYDGTAASMIAMLRYGLPPLIQMCDALSRNEPRLADPIEILHANCNAHGRRNFVKVTANFPEPCRFVLETLGEVYGYDAVTREQGMSPEARLHFHQEHSGPVMEQLRTWLHAQFDTRKVEPNSGLGQAISYLLKHWQKLTLFLQRPGVPLDNNIVERALKKAILHRKNSLFYKTRHGAQMGDLFMSLIHTCELNGVNPFDYLTELQRHAAELKQNPSEWMPWNYRDTLARLARPAAA